MRIGVIGLGTVGETHLAALRQLRVKQVFGADPSAAARARASAYVAHCFADYREMFSSADLDGVVVATPPRTHREIAVAALEAGLGVLCEKPLAVTIEDCEAISAAVGNARGPFQVGFCHRFQPQVRALRGLLDSGAIGRPVLANISFIHGLTEQGRQWITDADQAGGGVLFDSGSHAIDLFRYLIGDVDDVHGLIAVLDGGSRSQRVEDTSIVSLRSGDVLGTIGLSWKTPPWQGLVEVIGSTGRACGVRGRPRQSQAAHWRRSRALPAYTWREPFRFADAPLPGLYTRRGGTPGHRWKRTGGDQNRAAGL